MSTLPFTNNELFEHVQSQLNRPVIGLFWTGSRVNNLQQRNSDYDVIAITDVNTTDILKQTHYRETVNAQFYQKKLEIKVIDVISLYQSLIKGDWILVEALSQRPISIQPYFKSLFARLSDSNWLISSCPNNYARSAIGQSIAILNRTKSNHRRWRHDIYYITKLDNYLHQLINHPNIYGDAYTLITKNLTEVQNARYQLYGQDLNQITSEQASLLVQKEINQLTKTANIFQKVYHNNNTQDDLAKIFSNWVLVNRDIPMLI